MHGWTVHAAPSPAAPACLSTFRCEIARLRSTQVDIDAPAVQAGKKTHCTKSDNSTLDLVLDYLYVNETRSDADDLQCVLPPFNGTVEVRTAVAVQVGAPCRGMRGREEARGWPH